MEERWFSSFKTTSMLHCDKQFRMEICSFCFKFDDMVPRKARSMAAPFFELLNTPVLEHKAYLKKLLFIVL